MLVNVNISDQCIICTGVLIARSHQLIYDFVRLLSNQTVAVFSRYLQISCGYTAPYLFSKATLEETRILDDSCGLATCFGDYLSSNARVVSIIYVLEGLRLQVNYKLNTTYEYHEC